MIHRPASRERAQSELVGFAFIFGVVLLAIVTLSVAGYAGLESAQDHERTTAAQAAMTSLADNVDEVAGSAAPSRSTELSLSDASLSSSQAERIEISGEQQSDPDASFTHEQSIRPLVWDDGDGTEIRYANGAVIRSDDDNAVMIREPNVLLSDEAVVLPIVRTDFESDGARAVGGSDTVLVRTVHNGTDHVRTDREPYDLTITITSDRAAAWESYLADQPATEDCTRTDDEVSCDLSSEQVVVTVEHVAVSIG